MGETGGRRKVPSHESKRCNMKDTVRNSFNDDRKQINGVSFGIPGATGEPGWLQSLAGNCLRREVHILPQERSDATVFHTAGGEFKSGSLDTREKASVLHHEHQVAKTGSKTEETSRKRD